jgi:uncharacterized iron-regulated membrane protein
MPPRKIWLRRTHGLLGVISGFNLFVLITTGFLLQHMTLLRLDERVISRRLLPGGYRELDGGSGVRADIVVADIHSGRVFGVTGALVLDGMTLAWLVMLATGLVVYFAKRGNGKDKQSSNSLHEDYVNGDSDLGGAE